MPVTFGSATELAQALRRAADAHHQYEQEIGQPDPDWPSWYAHYIERDQARPEAEHTVPGRSGATVPVTAVPSRMEAELIAGMLRNHDVTAVVAADDAAGLQPPLQAHGVRVLVAPSDEAAARRLLAASYDTSE